MNKDYPEMNIEHNEQGLTVERLREFPGCEHYTDEEAIQVVQGLKQLAEILLEITLKENYCTDNQLVVSLGYKNKAA